MKITNKVHTKKEWYTIAWIHFFVLLSPVGASLWGTLLCSGDVFNTVCSSGIYFLDRYLIGVSLLFGLTCFLFGLCFLMWVFAVISIIKLLVALMMLLRVSDELVQEEGKRAPKKKPEYNIYLIVTATFIMFLLLVIIGSFI